MELTITDAATLGAACDAMHDAEFDLDSVSFDPGAGTWSIAFKRADWDQAVAKRHLIGHSTSAPIVNAVLAFDRVRRFAVNDRSRIGLHSFDECHSEGDEYRFVFHTDMDFALEFDGAPSGTLRDGDPAGGSTTVWGFGQRT